jgi:uncharacterized membrane protein YcaP (DUF421 family)
MPAFLSRWDDFMLLVFGGDIPQEPLQLHQVAMRAVVVYLVGIAIVRIGKSRSIARATAVDVLLGFILGSLLSRGITGHASMSGTAMASAAIVATHYVITLWGVNHDWFGTLLKGHAYLLVENGVCNEEALCRSHLSHKDLEEQLRLKGVASLDQVEQAWKERSGEVSVIAKKKG